MIPAHVVSAVTSLVAVLTAGLAAYYWRRSAGLYSLLVEGANRYEELRQRTATMEQGLLKADEKAKQQRDATQRLTQGLDEARAKTAELTQRLEAKDHETRLVAEKLELQKGFLEKQLAKSQEMLRVAEEQRLAQAGAAEATRQELEKARRSLQEAQAVHRQELAVRDKDWHLKLKDAEAQKADAEKKAAAGDPVEMRKLKRKISQYDRLYSSMKGLREMSEERNRNWEVALRRLAAYIIQETGVAPELVRKGDAAPIGPLVGHALQAIGATLVDDDAHEPAAGGGKTAAGGASRAEAMDDLPEPGAGETP